MGILMLVCGILGVVFSLIPIAVNVLGALVGIKLKELLTLVLGTILFVISTVLRIFAGVKGISASTRPKKTPGV